MRPFASNLDPSPIAMTVFHRIRLPLAAAIGLAGGLAFAPSPAAAAIAHRATATANAGQNSSNITINKPPGVVAGDVMIAVIAKNVSTIGITTAPSGWLQIDQRPIRTDGANNKIHGATFYRVADGSEGSNFSFGLGGGTSAAPSNGAAGAIVAFSGVAGSGGVHADGSPGGPFDVATGTIRINPTGSAVTADSITTQTDNAAVVMLGMVGGNSFTWSNWNTTSPGTLDEIADRPKQGNSVGAAWAVKPIPGATGEGSATLSDTRQPPAAILVALKKDTRPDISAFAASPSSMFPGGESTLSWSVDGADSVSIDNGIGAVADAGTVTVSPAATTSYTLTATNSDGTVTATATVTLAPPVIHSFTATPGALEPGESATLSWDVTGATSLSIDNGVGAVDNPSGSTSVSPAETTTYALSATNDAGTTTATVTVGVVQPGPYRYYRFVPVELRDESAGMIHISEFQMLLDGVRVTGATASNPGGDSPGSEGPDKANDDNVDSKWLDFNIQPLILDFGVTTDVNGYRWATANDSEGRDPVSWRVDGSHDLAAWKVLDTRTGETVPTARKTYLADFSFESFSGPSIAAFTANPVTLFLGEATSSTLSWSVTNADPGGVSIDNGIGVVDPNDSLAVSPAETTTYTLTATGDGVARTRSVTVRRVPVGSLRYFRFVPLATRGGGAPVSLAEFEILWNGQRVGGAVASNPGGLTPGNSGATQANDDNLDTEWLSFNFTPVVLDFGDLVGFNGYRWATGIGASSQDPVSWRIDGSVDGLTWTTLDERTNASVPTDRKTYLAAIEFNNPPTFGGLAAATPYETPASITLGKILAEAADPDGDALTVTAAGPASAQGGTATLAAGAILYTPPGGFAGTDSFSVTITDARGASVTGTVTVTVAGDSGIGSNPPAVTMLPGGGAKIDFQGIPGRSYEIQRSTDLENWIVLATLQAGPSGGVSHTDETPPAGSAFYRLRRP